MTAALVAGIAAWLSQGTVAPASAGGPRIALLPLSPAAIATSGAAMAGALALARAGASLIPLWLLILVVLPWLPFPVPPAFLIWAGRLDLLVWFAVALLLAGGVAARKRAERPAARARVRPQALAGLLSAVIVGAAAWFSAPSVPGGDEPHYLVITQSLLFDGDLRIENNHLRRDYQPYFAGQLKPDYIRRGQDGEIYSIHAPGISAIVAPAFAVGGYPAVVLCLIGAAALGGALMWHVSWLATRHTSAAWFGWAAITCSATMIFHSFTVYPDGLGGTIVLTGVWGLLRAEAEHRDGKRSTFPWVFHGAALALLPWLHTRFALLAASLGTLLLLRLVATPNPIQRVVAFLGVPTVSALGWLAYFLVIYGTPDPSAPYGSTREFSAAFIPGGLAGVLFDQRFGLVSNAPVLLCAAAGLGGMILRPRSTEAGAAGSQRRIALELLIIVAPYLLIVTSFAMWWGGWSAPARFTAVLLPSMALPCAAAWLNCRTSASRVMAAGALALTAFISAALIVPERGRLAFNTRETHALWLEWVSPVADLARGLPLWVRGGERTFFVEILVWAALLASAAAVVRVLPLRRGRATACALVFALAGMGAATWTWKLHGDDGTSETQAQLGYLRRLSSEPEGLTMRLTPPARASVDQIVGMIRIDPGADRVSSGPARPRNGPLLVLPGLPAGRYRIRTESDDPAGSLMAGIGQDQHPLRTEPLTSRAQSFDIAIPVDVRALVVEADEAARRAVTGITVEPLAIQRGANRLTDAFGRRFLRYGATSVYFLDDRSFPEPDAFWVGGSRSSSVALQPDASTAAIRLLLRNAPVQNKVRLEAGAWRADLDLAPGEERYLDVPLNEGRGATLLTISSSAGFRPSEVVAGSGDERFLGVWIKVGA